MRAAAWCTGARHEPISRRSLVVVSCRLALSGIATACGFDFKRLDNVPPGSVSGRTIDADSTVLSFSRIGVESSSRVVRALDDGNFRVQGLTAGACSRLESDQDGDGVAERSAIRAVKINTITDLKGAKVLSSVLLGDVQADGTATLLGRVLLPDATTPAVGARVVVYRNTADLAADQNVDVGNFDVDLGIEQETATDIDGFYRLDGVAIGNVRVAAVLTGVLPDGSDSLASAPVSAVAAPGRVVPVDDVVLAPATTRPAQIQIVNPPNDGTIIIGVVKHGGDIANDTDILVHHEVDVAGAGAAGVASIGGFDVPTTVVDVYVLDQGPDGEARRNGTLIGRVVTSGVASAVVWGQLELIGGSDFCGSPTDRDGDGLAALPASTPTATVTRGSRAPGNARTRSASAAASPPRAASRTRAA